MRGARAEEVEALADRGILALRGVRAAEVAELVADAMEPVLKPLLAPEVVDAAHGYRDRADRVYIVSTALQEIVDAVVADLGLDGGIGTVCEVEDGLYTGRSERPSHGTAKADALTELAASRVARPRGLDGVLRQPLRPAVPRGRGPSGRRQSDRALRKVAQARGWPILEPRRRAA